MLNLPDRLEKLIQNGFWPITNQSCQKQNLNSLVDRDLLKQYAPEEDCIFFYQPPFKTIEQEINEGMEIWKETMSAPEMVSFHSSLIIGDFGLGSDAPIILDYRQSPPTVLRLVWSEDGSDNEWKLWFNTFDEMCDTLQMDAPPMV